MADPLELADEQSYFERAWERREEARAVAVGARGEGNRYDVRAYVSQNRAYAEQLAGPDVEVAHGSVALDDGEVVYVGRNSIFDADRNVLVVNWRTPVGELYERATVRDALGVARKRAYRTERNQVLDFDDVIFAELASKVADLSEVQLSGVDDALLEDLGAGRTGAMRDIVRTIQASQSGLIRHPADSLLVIQGGPGTGKSAVALHRVSWLLFNEAGLSPERTLVIGPSQTFTSYIKDVLPGLGDARVPQANLRNLGPQTSSRRDEPPAAARLKGDRRMAGLLLRALHLRIRFAGDDPALLIGSGASAIAVPREEVEAQLETLRRLPSYSGGRTAMRAWLTTRAQEIALARQGNVGRVDVEAQAVDLALDRVWPTLTAQQFLRDLLGSPARLREAAGDSFTAGDVGRLHRQAAANLSIESWSDSDVALIDEADYMIRRSTERFQHIVIDEAQDLSPMQLRSIKRRSANGHYTVVGDIAQSTGPWARDTWDDVVAGLRQERPLVYEELEFGYRVPAEIYEVASTLLPLISPTVTPVTVVRPAPEAPTFILDNGDYDLTDEVVSAVEEHAKRGRFIGVIVAPGDKNAIATGMAERGISFSDADRGSLGSSVNLITATEAKGLEFDAVVVVEPAAIASIDERGMSLLYIALTRATKYLTVVHAQAFEALGLDGVPPVAEPELSYTEQLFVDAEDAPPTAPSEMSPDRAPASTSSLSQPAAALSPMLLASASSLAGQIRDGVPASKWDAVLGEVARLLVAQRNEGSTGV